jgi:hypothetical protein
LPPSLTPLTDVVVSHRCSAAGVVICHPRLGLVRNVLTSVTHLRPNSPFANRMVHRCGLTTSSRHQNQGAILSSKPPFAKMRASWDRSVTIERQFALRMTTGRQATYSGVRRSGNDPNAENEFNHHPFCTSEKMETNTVWTIRIAVSHRLI